MAFVLGLLIWFIFISPKLSELQRFGLHIGTYEVPKKKWITVASGELSIKLDSDIYNYIYGPEGVTDSFIVYPSVSIFCPTLIGNTSGPHRNFSIGRRLFVATDHFYYTIQLTNLLETTRDTIATFEVFRRELPTVIPKKD